MKNLNQLKTRLKDELPNKGITYIIKSLKELLPSFSPKYDLLISIESEYNRLKKDRLGGTLDFLLANQTENQINKRLLNLITDLKRKDFSKKNRKSKLSKKQTYKTGHVLYQIPKKMTVFEETLCRVRIAFDEKMIRQDLKLDDDTKIKLEVRISDYMQVEIIDPTNNQAFEVRPNKKNKEDREELTQFIDEDLYTEWKFYVKPLKQGEHILELKATVIEIINGKEIPRKLTLEESVIIIAEEVIKEEIEFKKAREELLIIPNAIEIEKIPGFGFNLPKLGRSPAIALLLLISFVGSYAIPSVQVAIDYYLANVKEIWEEETECKIVAYDNFQNKYYQRENPSSKVLKYVGWVLNKLESLEWAEAKSINTKFEYRDYLEKSFKYLDHLDQHPELLGPSESVSSRIDTAEIILEVFEKEEALVDSSEQEALDYLTKYDSGKYIPQIVAHVETIEWNRTKPKPIKDTLELAKAIVDYLNRFPDGTKSDEARNLLDSILTPKKELIKTINNYIDNLNPIPGSDIASEQSRSINPLESKVDIFGSIINRVRKPPPVEPTQPDIPTKIGTTEVPLKNTLEFSMDYEVFNSSTLLPLNGVTLTLTNDCGDEEQSFVTNSIGGVFSFKLKEDCCYSLKGAKDNFQDTMVINQCTRGLKESTTLQVNLNLQSVIPDKTEGRGRGEEGKETIVQDVEIDTDADGIPDSEDECVYEKGLLNLNGCPDTDGDSIADKDDQCPDIFGYTKNFGCPEPLSDLDNDGVPDEEDTCPGLFGLNTNDGCPEFKKDSIIDTRDGKIYPTILINDQWWMAKDLDFEASYSSSPTINNPKNLKSSRSYDWKESKSFCPKGWHLPSEKEWLGLLMNTIGKSDTNDISYDGWIEGGAIGFNGNLGRYWSSTPTQYDSIRTYYFNHHLKEIIPESNNRKKENISCRCVKDIERSSNDRDADGIPNAKDKCPLIKGDLSANGCPDFDADGITDQADKCPGLFGFDSNSGCPEFDKDTLIDSRDGQAYPIIHINDQWWMAKNLNFETKEGSYCFKNKAKNCLKYGRLYSYEVSKKACPPGWHIPSEAEWRNLFKEVFNWQDSLMCDECFYPLLKGKGTTGFNAQLGGFKGKWHVVPTRRGTFILNFGSFSSKHIGLYHSDSENSLKILFDSKSVQLINYPKKNEAASCRCVKD